MSETAVRSAYFFLESWFSMLKVTSVCGRAVYTALTSANVFDLDSPAEFFLLRVGERKHLLRSRIDLAIFPDRLRHRRTSIHLCDKRRDELIR